MIQGRQFAARSTRGARPYQEDEFGFYSGLAESDESPHGLLMVIADGMGGHKGGAHASATAVERFIASFNASDGEIADRLRRSLADANRKIGADAKADAELDGMGCTFVAVVFRPEGMEWISVGDSPLWRYRSGKLTRLNEDHSMAPVLAEQVRGGEITADEAANHPRRNALRSALVGGSIPLVDRSEKPVTLRRGDMILLASDGLLTLSEDEITEVADDASRANADALAKRLLDEVAERDRPGQDNTTIMVVSPDLKAWQRRGGRRIAALLLVLLLAAGVAGALNQERWWPTVRAWVAGPAAPAPPTFEMPEVPL